MKQEKIVFSDVDGTLLNSEHRMTEATKKAVAALGRKGIPFVIVSARSPSGIAPLFEEGGFRGPLAAYSGGLLLDEDGAVLFSRGIEKSLAAEIISFLEKSGFSAAWNLYSYDQWLVRDRSDPKIAKEESIVHAKSEEGGISDMKGDVVHKILCICDPEDIDSIEKQVKEKFPQCAVVQSWITQLEIMPGGVHKGLAVRELCARKNVALENSIAFGDNYNDVEMLKTAGRGYLMDNAPAGMKAMGFFPARSNDEDGIYHALLELGLL